MVFDKTNLSEYLSYAEVAISSQYFGSITDSLVNTVASYGLSNTINPDKMVPVTKMGSKSYMDIINTTSLSFNDKDKAGHIKVFSSGATHNGAISIVGDDIFCISNTGRKESVMMSNLVNKDIIIVDVETTSIIQDIDSLRIFFDDTDINNFSSNNDAWMWSDSKTVYKEFNDKKVIQVEFEMKFNRNPGSNQMSKLLMIAGTSEGKVYKYGYERAFNGDMYIINEDSTVLKTIASSDSMKLVIRLSILSNVNSISFVFDRCSNDNMMIRNIIITQEK